MKSGKKLEMVIIPGLKIKSDKKKKLFRLIHIYLNFNDIVDNVKELNKKVDEIKKLKDSPESMDED